MDKVIAAAAEAVAVIPNGAASPSGGFGVCGIPAVLATEPGKIRDVV